MKLLLSFIVAMLITCAAYTQPPPAKEEPQRFAFVETMARFPGGRQKMTEFITANTVYPESEKKSGTEGKVLVEFIIDTTGAITEATVRESLGTAFNAEALRVINNMPRWEPAMAQGKLVRMRFSAYVVFTP